VASVVDVQVSDDLNQVAQVLFLCWDKYAEDGLDPNKTNIHQDERELWLDFLVDGELIGVCKVSPMQKHTVQVHPYLMYEHRFKFRSMCKALLKFLVKLGSVQKVQAIIGMNHNYVIKAAMNVGLVVEGMLSKSYFKNGEYHDQILLGITKEEVDRL